MIIVRTTITVYMEEYSFSRFHAYTQYVLNIFSEYDNDNQSPEKNFWIKFQINDYPDNDHKGKHQKKERKKSFFHPKKKLSSSINEGKKQ